MSLLNRLAEPTGREMHFPTEPLRLVITQPVLEKGGAVQTSVNERFPKNQNQGNKHT